MSDWLKNIIGAIVAAAAISSYGTYSNLQANTNLISQLSQSTDKLSDAVTELRITVGAQNEKFVTKDQLSLTIKDLKEELRHGS